MEKNDVYFQSGNKRNGIEDLLGCPFVSLESLLDFESFVDEIAYNSQNNNPKLISAYFTNNSMKIA